MMGHHLFRAPLAVLLAVVGVGAHATTVSSPAPSPLLKLSARQLAGQRVIYSYRGLTPPPSLIARIRAGEAAGVIFFTSNIASAAQLRGVVGQLQRAAAAGPVRAPLLMMLDQEGGLVRRLPGAPASSEQQIGASPRAVTDAGRAGATAATNLRGAGINVNLAPVLDVARARNGLMGQYGRSYGSRPGSVAQLGAAFITAQQKLSVAATAKHFPGLGAAGATQDTDTVPVTLGVPLASLRAVDEVPYRPAIAAGVRLVMVSWATYPALDRRRPAGLSATVVGGELRRRLGFTGVTVTDALEAGALRNFGGTASRATLAAGAGMDLLLCASGDVSQGTGATNALATALGQGRLGGSAFFAAVRRVIALRSSVAGARDR
jgi:beta-N-acetylhexosaminidase